MTDPFEALRAPLTPVDPDPAYAAALRARLERALALPKGVRVSTTDTTDVTPTASAATGAGVTPNLAVADARDALRWYADVLDARPHGEPIVMPDGRIGHAEIELAGGLLMLADEHPELGFVAPRPADGTAVLLHVEVGDVDALVDRAVAAGATLESPPEDEPYGRVARFRDPFGHRWMLSTPPPTGDRLREGDLAYVSLWVPDGERAAAFFASVLGWRYQPDQPGSGGQRHQVADVVPGHGLFGGQRRGTLFLCFAVGDLHAAVARVRGAGGRAAEPRQEPYGLVTDCVDDQGLRFALYQRSGDEPRPAATGVRPGDLAYVTLEVVDAAKARAFYGAVLGWRFTPGSVPDGWTVEDVAPMTGLHGGHDEATGVPMYRVADIDAAVRRVRAARGTATEPSRMPYGLTAECADDQGTRFWLGQL